MKTYKYLHLMHNEKFIAPFITFIKEHLDFREHFFILTGGDAKFTADIPIESNILYLNDSYESQYYYFKFSKILKRYTLQADKIIFHSLLKNNKILFLFFNQHLLYKCYWVMWGADLYVYNKPSNRIRGKIGHYIRTKIYSKMGHFVTYIKGDYELAQKWYKVDGKYHECFMYPSNLYTEYDIQSKGHKYINIQIGNSADPANNHLEVFEKLKKYKDEDINIFVPLSYGNIEYAKEVIIKGKEMFGDKFKPLTNFMAFEKYLIFLGDIDIAIFAHKRQQAMGNTITLLGLGKKVYIRSDITPWKLFNDIDVKVFDTEDIELKVLDDNKKEKNQQRIKEYFSKKNYLNQLKTLFES